jgi:hypothetical protein
MNTQHLKEKQKSFDDQISALKDKNGKSTPILDGIIDIEKYSNSKKKIMWVLKEVNSPNDTDKWDLRDAIKSLKTDFGIKAGWRKTFEPIVYATYGILNNCKWEEIPDVPDDPNIVDILHNIAYINVKKIPGGSVANNSELQEAYSENKIALAQIEAFNPDIVIFGNTIDFLKEDLDVDIKQEGYNRFAIKNNRLYINTYHPQYVSRKGNDFGKEYFNNILQIVNNYRIL